MNYEFPRTGPSLKYSSNSSGHRILFKVHSTEYIIGKYFITNNNYKNKDKKNIQKQRQKKVSSSFCAK